MNGTVRTTIAAWLDSPESSAKPIRRQRGPVSGEAGARLIARQRTLDLRAARELARRPLAEVAP